MRVFQSKLDRWLIGLLLLAALLRLAYGLTQDFDAYFTEGGGDTAWYLHNGYALVTGDDPTGLYDISRLPTAPLYLILIGTWQALLTQDASIAAILITQAFLGTSLVFWGYGLAHHLTRDQRVARLAAGVLAVSPALIIESAQILTETLYMALLMAGLWVYITRVTAPPEMAGLPRSVPWQALVVAGLLFGLATLTRAVLLLFPFGLAMHLVWTHRGRRGGWRCAGALLLIYSLVVLSWTAYNWIRWQRVVLGAEGYASFIYIGSQGWQGPAEVDQSLAEDAGDGPVTDTQAVEDLKRSEVFLRAARRIIAGDPSGYITHRLSELGSAYLQPHATVIIGGESLKEIARRWIDEDRSVDGLRDIIRQPTFLPKLILYIFHMVGLVAGVIGWWRYRRSPAAIPLAGLVAYTTAVHLVMLALPRYLFPLYPIFWIFAAAALITLWDRFRRSPVAIPRAWSPDQP